MEFNDLLTDEDAELNGAWVDMPKGYRIRVARAGNPRHKALVEKLQKPYRFYSLAGEPLPEKVSLEITVKAMAETLLLDWEGITENGEPVPYGKEKAIDFLTRSRDFREQVAAASLEQEHFALAARKALVGNSRGSSNGP